VNVGRDPAKSGVAPERALALAEEVAELESLRLRGLMTIPPLPDNPDDSREHYAELAGLGSRLSERIPGADQLSMGMTRDFEVAIEEGATLVRVGEAIFGPRRSAP
jgi:uncharacterized pyridoxal phosphate-containing UPF0001 family protein